MNFFEKIVVALQFGADPYPSYGWFHLTFVALSIISTIFLCIKAKNISDKSFRKVMFIVWLVVLALELYKQLVYSYTASEDKWKYLWYYFPFQLCSMPLYTMPLIALLKDSKFRDGVIVFFSTFVFFGGLCVYAFPGDVLSGYILGIHFQTMIHHGVQVVFGIYTAVYYRKKFKPITFLYAIGLFVICFLIALAMNKFVSVANLNMFFIGPKIACTLPLLGSIYPKVPYIVFLLIYTLGFTFCAGLMGAIFEGSMKLSDKLKSKKIRENN